MSLAGTWAYRSYLDQAAQPLFGSGTFTFHTPIPGAPTGVTGTLVMSPTLVLDLKGTFQPAGTHVPLVFEINGYGRAGTATNGWQYDYHGYLAYHWPTGVNQVQSLVGTVLRAKPHNGQPAGVTASFIAVRLT